VGGLVAFGIVGIFVGPVVLAVAYTLIDNWVGAEPPTDDQGAQGPRP
jgi:predicted PurR-regulated permease PerM